MVLPFDSVLTWLTEAFAFSWRVSWGLSASCGLIHILAVGQGSSIPIFLASPIGFCGLLHMATEFQENESRNCESSWSSGWEVRQLQASCILQVKANPEASHIQEGGEIEPLS